ncbi:MAG: DUF1919 domain-containing protein [Lachnospiraceae bacterium]|nr:DUF1919 domain-containing protein [Candidatus Colinaster equi]
MHKVILWGMGDGYNRFVSYRGYEQVEIVALVDSGNMYHSQIDGIPIINPKSIRDKNIYFEYIVVTVVSKQYFEEIVSEAEKLGIYREKIIPLRVFQIPFFNFDDYIRIKESNISIVSDYCLGGFLYHKFGLKFLSPTINMFSTNDNYIKFIENMDRYMNMPMVETTDTINNTYLGRFTFPRGYVGDVEWIFNHALDFEEAAERWEKGVSRFNWENYIVLMTIRSDEMAYRFNELQIANKIGFYWKDLKLENVVCLKEWDSPQIRQRFGYDFARYVNEIANEGFGVRAIDWMNVLLHKKTITRVD